MRSHEFHATPTAAPVPAPLSHAVTLHHAHHAAVAMARLWRQHARRGAAGAQRVLVWKEAAGGPAAGAPASVTACARIDLELHGPWLLDLPDGAWGLLDDGWLRPVGRLNAVGDPIAATCWSGRRRMSPRRRTRRCCARPREEPG